MKRIALIGGLLAATLTVNAQTAAPTPSSPAKKELAAKIVKLQQPLVENLARQLVELPAIQMLQQLGPVLQQRVSADRRQAVAADIQADARKYSEEMVPLARDKATKLAPAVWQPILEEKFTEDELKQLIAIIESPVNRKFQAVGGEMVRAINEKLVAELRPTIEPKLKALNQTIAGRLQPAASSPGK